MAKTDSLLLYSIMAETTSDPERRQFPRFEFGATPWIFSLLLKEEHIPQSPLQLEAQNISIGGLKFRSNRKIGIFDEVSVQLLHRDSTDDPITISGKVVRVDETDIGVSEKNYGMAVQFEDLSDRIFSQMSVVFIEIS